MLGLTLAILFAVGVSAALLVRSRKRPSAPSAVVLSDPIPLRETFGGVGNSLHLKHVPPPGCACVEVTAGDGRVLAFDTLRVPEPAPAGSVAPYTSVMAPVGADILAYKYATFVAGAPLPFTLPEHLSRSDASYYHVWWSQEVARAE